MGGYQTRLDNHHRRGPHKLGGKYALREGGGPEGGGEKKRGKKTHEEAEGKSPEMGGARGGAKIKEGLDWLAELKLSPSAG